MTKSTDWAVAEDRPAPVEDADPQGFACHVVPTGVVRDHDDLLISATLAFTPTSEGVLLESWPSAITQVLAGLRASARLAGTTDAYDLAKFENLHETRARAAKTNFAELLRAVDKLWLEAVLLGSSAGLQAILSASRVGDSNKELLPKTGAATSAPDIVTVPRGDLALLYALQRAKAAADRVHEALTTVSPSKPEAACKINLGLSNDWFSRPWARLPNPFEKRTRLAMAVAARDRIRVAALNADEILVAQADPAPPPPPAYSPFRYSDGNHYPHEDQYTLLDAALKEEHKELRPAVDSHLHLSRQAAANVANAKKAIGSTAPDAGAPTVETALRNFGRARAGGISANAVSKTCIDDPKQFHELCNDRLAVHVAGLMPDADDQALAPVEFVKQRWMAVQTQPSLMRLFQLVVDVRFRVSKEHLAALAPNGEPAFLEFGIVDAADGDALWVLTKLVPPRAHGETGSIWPATRAEWLQSTIGKVATASDVRAYGAIDQIEGVYDLGAAFRDDDPAGAPPLAQWVRRFDVASLDMIDAAEVTVQEHKTQATTVADVGKPGCTGLPGPEVADVLGARTRRTAGLTLIDRWRQSAAVSQFVRSGDGAAGVKDADDLTIGFKIDISTSAAAPGTCATSAASNWRSLTDRYVAMSLPSALSRHSELTLLQGDGIDRAINALSPSDPGRDRKVTRRRIDGAIVTIPSRLRGNGTAQADAGKYTAFSEEIVTSWDGDPLGLRCGEGAVKVGVGGLPINMKFSLPTWHDAPDLAPHRLRLGAAYRLGARAVLVGGVSRPLPEAAELYDSWLDGDGLSLPGPKSKELRRFLRHERLDAPMVAIEQTHLLTELASDRPPLDGKEMIVRSSAPGTEDARQKWRYAPSDTSRVLFAPPVSLSFATWHGVFDAPAGGVSQAALLGGLSSVDYDAEWIGFPVLEADAPPLESSVRCDYRQGEKPDPSGTQASSPPSGTAVYRKARIPLAKRCKENRYHPDPAARFMVVALQRPDGDYLDDAGNAICVPLYPTAHAADGTLNGYPHAMPVILTLKADKTEKMRLTSYAALRRRANVRNDDAWPRVAIDKSKPLSPENAAIEVTIVLGPGEDFQVETWCIPDKTLLARWFDVPESLALLAGGSTADGHCGDLKTSLGAFSRLTGIDPSAFAQAKSHSGSTASCVKGDCKATLDLIKAIAGSLFDVMKRRPIPEIAAVRRLRTVHAIERPIGAPEFAPPELRILRVTKATWQAVIDKSLPNDPDDDEAAKRLQRLFDWKQWEVRDNEDNATQLLVGGEIDVDFASTGRIELRATAAAARGQPMDDPSRGRPPADRLTGEWALLNDPAATSDELRRASLAQRLFGFDVDAAGAARLPTQTVRIADWPIPGAGSAIGRQTFDMLELSRASGLDGHYFADGKARRLGLKLYATSRTALLITARSTYPTKSEDDDDGRRRYLASTHPAREVIVRATVRPSAIKAQSLLPVFAWKPEGAWLSRKTKIRIRCARPHFTSGVEERWGIVLWPPNMFDVKRGVWSSENLRAGRMRRQEPVADGEAEDFDLLATPAANEDWREPFFTDDDLGNGGKYVTRWGLDPIRKGGSLDWFLSPDALVDETTSSGALREDRPPAKTSPASSALPIDMISTDGEDTAAIWPLEDSRRPRLVENVLLPIPVDDTAPDALGADPSFMQVSLMTYEPRFDPDFEHWYIDVDIAPGLAVDPFLRVGIVRFQPHARRTLQCSSPNAEWVQIVGYSRRVNAEVAVDGSGVRTAKIKVSGPAPTDGADEAQSSFRATLYERWRSPLGHVSERAVRSEAAGEDGLGAVVAVRELTFQKGDDIWKGDLDLPAGRGATYAVLVEEVNRMKPSQHAVEPHNDAGDDKTSTTGPRFAAFIDLLSTEAEAAPVVARF